MRESLVLIFSTFLASFGFGIVFRIERRYLLLAGLSGALMRTINIILLGVTSETFVCSFLAATAAALYSEIMAVRTKRPAIMYIYPSIVPLMPGGNLYYSIVGIMLQDMELVKENLIPCIHTLAGLGLGFIIISIIMYYQRRYSRMKKRISLHI